jgi:hypothetical protein
MNRYEKMRQKALSAYYTDPTRCKECGSIILVQDHEQPTVARNKKFCGKSCAAKFNNKRYPKRKPKPKECSKCGKLIVSRGACCEPCKNFIARESLGSRTKGELKRENLYTYKSRIAAHARVKYLAHRDASSCIICGYSKHIQICHIKSIASFDDTTLVKDINSLTNLIHLCSNHHIELDRGLLSEEDFERLHIVVRKETKCQKYF